MSITSGWPTRHAMTQDRRTAFGLLKADFRRRLELEGRSVSMWNAAHLLLRPGAFGVAAYRLSTWLHINHHTTLSKIVELIQYKFSSIELQIGSEIAGGLVIADVRGVALTKDMKVGRNLTILGASTVTLGGMASVDLDHDFISIGEHCVLGAGSKVLGAVTLADETQVKPNSVVISSSPVPGGILDGIPARRKGTAPEGSVAAWSPLRQRRWAACAASRAEGAVP